MLTSSLFVISVITKAKLKDSFPQAHGALELLNITAL